MIDFMERLLDCEDQSENFSTVKSYEDFMNNRLPISGSRDIDD